MGGWWGEYSFRCQPVDYSDSPTAIRVSLRSPLGIYSSFRRQAATQRRRSFCFLYRFFIFFVFFFDCQTCECDVWYGRFQTLVTALGHPGVWKLQSNVEFWIIYYSPADLQMKRHVGVLHCLDWVNVVWSLYSLRIIWALWIIVILFLNLKNFKVRKWALIYFHLNLFLNHKSLNYLLFINVFYDYESFTLNINKKIIIFIYFKNVKNISMIPMKIC